MWALECVLGRSHSEPSNQLSRIHVETSILLPYTPGMCWGGFMAERWRCGESMLGDGWETQILIWCYVTMYSEYDSGVLSMSEF